MKDLQSPTAMWVKALLFLVIGFTAVALLWTEVPKLKTALLLALTIWAFCRAYYFAFYVLEKYADPQFRYTGLWSLFRYLRHQRRNRNPSR